MLGRCYSMHCMELTEFRDLSQAGRLELNDLIRLYAFLEVGPER